MADHQFFETFRHSFSLADIDPDIEIINYLSGLYQNDQDSSSSALSFHHNSMNVENMNGGVFANAENGVLNPTQPIISSKERKRKANDKETTSANTSPHSSPQVSDHSGSRKTKRGGRGKKATKSDDKEREVIHVRAKRGQATDSHSLAERVRRGKINERLRCLQDIVPGCYKTMGMAVMLDEIINYVQSLQNQVDFLSMKLTAASSFYDFNTETDAIEAMQRGNAFEAVKIEDVAFPSAQLAQNLGYYCPQLPHSR